MFTETTYPGFSQNPFLGSSFLSGDPAWVVLGFPNKAAWVQAGRPPVSSSSPGVVGPVQPAVIPPGPPGPAPTTTIPTTEPNQCPPNMTYSPPPPGSGTGSCTGPTQVGGATQGAGSGDGLGGLLSTTILGIPILYIGIGIIAVVLLRK